MKPGENTAGVLMFLVNQHSVIYLLCFAMKTHETHPKLIYLVTGGSCLHKLNFLFRYHFKIVNQI